MNDPSLEVLREMLGYMREIASVHRRDDLRRVLSDAPRRRAYKLSNGENTRSQIGSDRQVQVTQRTISSWWSEWVDEGLADRTEDGSVRARYDLHVLRVSDEDG